MREQRRERGRVGEDGMECHAMDVGEDGWVGLGVMEKREGKERSGT